MSYGIQVQNTDSRIQIDENYSNVYKQASGNATASTAYPPSGYTAGDLVLCRAKSSGYVGTGFGTVRQFWSTGNSLGYSYNAPSSGYEYLIARKIAGNISPASSGYGLEVFNSSSQLTFSATGISSNLRVLASGDLTNTNSSTTDTFELDFPSSTGTYSDLTKIFCVINGGTHLRIYAPELGLNLELVTGYEYNFTSGNAGRITVSNKILDSGTEYAGGVQFSYIIMELVD